MFQIKEFRFVCALEGDGKGGHNRKKKHKFMFKSMKVIIKKLKFVPIEEGFKKKL